MKHVIGLIRIEDYTYRIYPYPKKGGSRGEHGELGLRRLRRSSYDGPGFVPPIGWGVVDENRPHPLFAGGYLLIRNREIDRNTLSQFLLKI